MPGTQTVGDGTDYIAQVAGSMSSATGTFPVFSCTSSPGCQPTETGSFGHSGPGGPQTPNIFSLQLNTNFGITTSLCPTTSTGCGGVLQFIYSAQDNSINVQPALAGFGSGTCPTGFGNQAGNCYETGLPAAPLPTTLTVADLSNVSFTGSVLAGADTVVLTDAGTATAVADVSPLDAVGQWTQAEFGVLGDAGGSQALFSPDTTIVAQTSPDTGTDAAPTCVNGEITLETNNLNQVDTPTSLAGSSPAILSEQSNSLTTPGSCVTAPQPATTSTSVTSSPNPSTVGNPVTLEATVTPTDGGGTVAFYADGSTTPISGCGTQTLSPVSGSTYHATCVTSSLGVGPHSISATYSGDNGYAGSSGSLAGPQVVDQISTTTIVTSSPNPSTFGQTVTFTAIETPTDGGGTTAFYADGSTTPISGCGAELLTLVAGTYQASCATSTLGAGPHPISATYSGDTDYAGGSGSLPGGQVVSRASTATTLASSVHPSVHHQPVTFTATVVPTDGSGTVAFLAGTKTIPHCSAQTLSLVGADYEATCTDCLPQGGAPQHHRHLLR